VRFEVRRRVNRTPRQSEVFFDARTNGKVNKTSKGENFWRVYAVQTVFTVQSNSEVQQQRRFVPLFLLVGFLLMGAGALVGRSPLRLNSEGLSVPGTMVALARHQLRHRRTVE